MRFAPALSTSCTKGSRFSSTSSCTRSCLSRPMGWSAPASMPASDALTMQRTPETKPIPEMTPPPGTPRAPHAAHARDEADPRDDAAARHAPVEVGIVEAEARERAQLEEGGAGVEQQREALAREELA